MVQLKKNSIFLVIGGFIGCVLLAFAQPALGQGGRLVSKAELDQFEALGVTVTNKLMRGETAIGEEQRKQIALMAKYYVYYMTIPEWQKSGDVAKRRGDFKNYMDSIIVKNGDANKDFRKALCEEMLKCFRTVFAKNALGQPENDMASCVNAGLLLPTFAQLDNIEILDFLVDLIRDRGKPPAAWATTLAGIAAAPAGETPLLCAAAFTPMRSYGKDDAIKLFGFQALDVFLRPQPFLTHPPKELNLGFKTTGFLEPEKRRQLADRVNPIIDYILTTPHLGSAAEVDGFLYIRCEAVKALSQFPLAYVSDSPSLGNPPTPGRILAAPAYALMRVLADEATLADEDDLLDPPPTLHEKFHAALGLCRIEGGAKLDEALNSRYNQQMAAFLVGSFAREYVNGYIDDFNYFKKDKESANLYPPRLPWKLTSSIFLDTLQKKALTNFTSPDALKTVQNIEQKIGNTLAGMRNWIRQDRPTALTEYLKNLPAPNPLVYLNSDYQIKLRKYGSTSE